MAFSRFIRLFFLLGLLHTGAATAVFAINKTAILNYTEDTEPVSGRHAYYDVSDTRPVDSPLWFDILPNPFSDDTSEDDHSNEDDEKEPEDDDDTGSHLVALSLVWSEYHKICKLNPDGDFAAHTASLPRYVLFCCWKHFLA